MIDIKAQYSIEFILVFAFSLIIIIPLINLMHSEYNQNKLDLDQSQAKQVLNEISLAAQNAFYSGYPTRTTLQSVYFPSEIQSITAMPSTVSGVTKSELVFKFRRGSADTDLVAGPFPFDISVSLKTAEGNRNILIKAEQNATGLTYVTITDS